MSWSQSDNKQYRGKIDRVFVSQTEYYEVAYFVDDYLQTHRYAITEDNRKKVRDAMEQYPGRAPVKRADLTQWLNGHWTKAR